MTDVVPLSGRAGISILPRRNAGMLLFVTLSLLITMSLDQLGSIERGSLRYWLLIAAASLLPLLNLQEIIKSLFDRAKLLFVLLLLGGGWHLLWGDPRATVQLLVLIVALTWISTDRALMCVTDLVRLYLMLIVLGALIQVMTSLNVYGLVPGFSDPAFGRWRVSFFPNIAYTGILSLAVFMVLTRSETLARAHTLVLVLAVYFLIFSFVRGALVAAVIYLALFYWFNRYPVPRPRRMFWIASSVAICFNVAILFSGGVLYYFQDNSIVSALLLRGQTGLSLEQIQYQLYRPWLWETQFQLFQSSPWLMGWGSADFYQLVSGMYENAKDMLISGGAESIPARMLVAYGLVGVLFTLYFFVRLRDFARQDDRWACACFPALFVLMMNWGSVFHPTDGMFVLLLLIMTRGSEGYWAGEGTLPRAPELVP
jgi:hypothetical protein